MRTIPITLVAFAMGTILLAQEKAPSGGVPANMIVTVEARHGDQAPVLHEGDVLAFQKNDRLRVSSLLPCQGEHAALELFMLIDDSSGTSLGTQLNDLNRFIDSQPATASVAVAYMSNGTVATAQRLTTDHTLAAKALRLPLGSAGISPSPFLSLSDLIKRWPVSTARREIVLVSSGIDPLGGELIDPYLDTAIEQAQRAGIVIYTIYTPAAGHFGHSFWLINWGQNHLTQLAEETGGESYMIGFGPTVSFAPYLRQIGDHLANQYLARFLMKPHNKAGLQAVRFATEVPNADLVAASKVYVPAEAK